MKPLQLSLSIIGILLLNIIIYYRALFTIEPSVEIFAECARNSGRTSALINLIILLILGYFGLKHILTSTTLKNTLTTLTILFAVNHFIHFLFVIQNFDSYGYDFIATEHLHGMFTFFSIFIIPFLLHWLKKLHWSIYTLIILHFYNVTYLISDTFYARYKPIDPAYLHRIGVVVMILACVYIFYRTVIELRKMHLSR